MSYLLFFSLLQSCFPVSCLMYHRLCSSNRVSTDVVLWFFSKVMMDGKWTEKPDKATLHQSAIELRGSTVASASRCLLVEVCPKPPNPYARIDGSFTSLHLCFPPPISVCLESDATFFFLSFSLVYSLLQSCVCPQTGTLLICTVLSLGWCNDLKKKMTIKDVWN